MGPIGLLSGSNLIWDYWYALWEQSDLGLFVGFLEQSDRDYWFALWKQSDVGLGLFSRSNLIWDLGLLSRSSLMWDYWFCFQGAI